MLNDVQLKAREALAALGRILDVFEATPTEDAKTLLEWDGGAVTAEELHVMRRKALAHWHPDKRESWKSALVPPKVEDFGEDDGEARYLFTVDYYVSLYDRFARHGRNGYAPGPLSYSFYLGQVLTQCGGDLDRAEAFLSEPSTVADIEAREYTAGQVPTMRARMMARLQGIRELSASHAEAKAQAAGGFDDMGHRVVNALAFLEKNFLA